MTRLFPMHCACDFPNYILPEINYSFIKQHTIRLPKPKRPIFDGLG